MLTHSEGVVMLPLATPRVAVEELFDDAGRPMYMIKIITIHGAEITVGRKRDLALAEVQAEYLRTALPGIDVR